MFTKKRILIAILTVCILAVCLTVTLLGVYWGTMTTAEEFITIPMHRIAQESTNIVDKTGNYLGHPDLALTSEDSNQLIVMYPAGHGKGAIITKTSDDFGLTWSERRTDTPKSWEKSQETPTLYRLDMTDGSEKLIVVSGCPSWAKDDEYLADGFQCSVSNDMGKTWTEFRKFYGIEWANAQPPRNDAAIAAMDEESRLTLPNYDTNGKALPYDVIVAMSSLTQLRDENGNPIDAWMGTFHDYGFYNYSSILTFDESGDPQWSAPRRYLAPYRNWEEKSNICEVEVIRDPNSNTLILIGRANSRKTNSIITFSDDEGKTWTEPKELPYELCGDRHKAEYDATTGKLVISFRQLIPGHKSNALASENFLAGNWVAWVGTVDDLLTYRDADASNDARGEALIVLGTNNNHGNPGDNGYSGIVCKDGQFCAVAYGRFDDSSRNPFILCARFRLSDFNL